MTGSHQASLEMLKNGIADVAAIDAVTWSIIERDTPAKVAGLEIVERSSEAPSPPYVVRRGVDREEVFRSLNKALESSASIDAKKALLIKDIIPTQRYRYFPILTEYKAIRDSASLNGQFVFDSL